MIFILSAIIVVVLIVTSVVVRRRPKKINQDKYMEQWMAIQKRCVDKTKWHEVVIDADKLLDSALKRRRFKGKSTGERLVAAQHELTNNETAWFGHKLHNKIEEEHLKQLTKQDTLEALSGFRQALKDLGALITPERRAEAEPESDSAGAE
jgi:hypothetical protein